MNNITNTMVKAITEEEMKAIKLFYDAWKKQPELLNEACAPDWQDIPLAPDQKEGPKGLQEIMNGFIENFPDIEVVIREIFGTNERVGVRAELTFTHNKEVLGIPPTNKKVILALHEFHHLKKGKITHTWHLEDWFGLLRQSIALSTKE